MRADWMRKANANKPSNLGKGRGHMSTSHKHFSFSLQKRMEASTIGRMHLPPLISISPPALTFVPPDVTGPLW